MSNNYYKFIIPANLEPRKPTVAVGRDAALDQIRRVIATTPAVVHYDLETTGLCYNDPAQAITNIGLATPDWVCGIDLTEVTFDEQTRLWDWLARQPLGGFNLGFDLAWPWRRDDGPGDLSSLNVVSDTALWFKLLATESHELQSHNLETLVRTVLQWPEKFQQKGWLAAALQKHQAKKSDMWKLSLAEPYGYTMYCALDAEASLQAHDVFQATLEHWGFSGLNKYHDTILIPKMIRNIKQTFHGIPINRDKLARNIDWVKRKMISLEAKILNHPEIQPALDVWTNRRLNKQHKLSFSMKKEWAKAEDKPWEKPNIYRLHIPANPDKLPKWCQEFGGKFYKPVTTFGISGQKEEWPRFNVNSTYDMKWLIYEHWLDNKYEVWYRIKGQPKKGGLVTVTRNEKQYTVDLTKTGGLPTGGDILTLFGEIGALMNEYKQLDKLLSDFLSKFELASRRDGRIHPHGKVLGTVTGRMSGGN